MTDQIERSVLVAASRETVWNAVASPQGLATWFCANGVTGKFEPGGDIEMHFKMNDGTGITGPARVVAIEPQNRFAYRWIPGNTTGKRLDDGATTLVEFFLTEESGGTRVRVLETGFASLPADAYESALKENTEGWDHELEELRAHFQK